MQRTLRPLRPPHRAAVSGVLSVLVVAAGLLAWAAGPPAARAEPRHGVALGAEPKYPAGFEHYDYANPDAHKGGRLTLSSEGSFDSLNPFSLKGRAAFRLGVLVFDTLTDHAMDEPFSEYGLLAESIDIADDGLSVTFRLRSGARFADGEPVTAGDVVFTFDTLTSPGAAPFYRYYYRDVEKVEAVNARTVRFTFARRNRELAMILGQLPVLPRHFYGQGDFGSDFVDKALGSGPYRVADYAFGKNIRYRRNPDYWGADLPVNVGRYNFDEVLIKFYRDSTVELEGLKSGEFDFMWVNSSKQWAVDVDGEKWRKGWVVKETLEHHNTAGMQGFAFNLRRPLFRQRAVRQALSLALDFEWSNQNLFYGQYTRLDSYFDNSPLAAEGLPSEAELKLLEPLREHLPPEVFDEPMGRGGPPEDMRTRLRRAKRLLNDAGWHVQDGVLTHAESGREMRFTITLVSPAFQRITEPYINNLRRLGVRADMKVVDSAVYEQLVRTFDFDVIVNVFGQSQSPGNEQRDYWHSQSAGVEGSRNVIGLENPAVDALVDEIIAAETRGKLVTAVHALDRALWYGYYVVPHWYIDRHRITYWNKFRYPETLPRYYNPLNHVMYWWVDPERRAALEAAMAEDRPIVLRR